MNVIKNDENLVLKIEDVRKEYMLGAVTGNTLKDAIKEKRGQKNANSLNKKFVALDGISFEIAKGECVGLIGSNGAGKSTLLKLISRITAPTDGRIYIDGRVASMLEVGTGFHPELTGRENIYLNGSILGMSKQEIDKKLDSIIEFSEVREFIDTPVKHYSSGMYVKLAFSVAAHLDAEIMIMDEVLAVGDVAFQHKCLKKMKEIATSEGRTIIYVSHNMDTIEKLCNRCLVLNKGKLIYDGDVPGATRLYYGMDIKTETEANFTKFIRPGWLQRDDVRLRSACYIDKTSNKVSDGKLKIFFDFELNKDVDNMCLRVELMDAAEKPFATKVFTNIFTGKAGDCGTVQAELDLSMVKNGIYQTFYTVFCIDPYGVGVDLDNVRGLDINVDKKETEGTLKWRNDAWGNVEL